MYDRAVFSAGPALCSIGKRQAEQRDLCDCTLLSPGITTIDGAVDHAAFSHNPSGLWVGKAHAQEVGQLCTGAGAGQRAIDPLMAAIGRLEDSAGVPDGPAGRHIGKIHIEQRDSSLRLLLGPGSPAIVRHQDGPYRPNRRPMLCGEKLYAIEGRACLARLIDPMQSAVLRMKNGAVATDDPSLVGRNEREAVERYLGIDNLRMPGIPSVLAPANRPIGSYGPSLLLIEKKDGREARRSAAGDFPPLLPSVDRLQNGAAGPDCPAQLRRLKIDSHQDGFRMAHLRGNRQRRVSGPRGRRA